MPTSKHFFKRQNPQNLRVTLLIRQEPVKGQGVTLFAGAVRRKKALPIMQLKKVKKLIFYKGKLTAIA